MLSEPLNTALVIATALAWATLTALGLLGFGFSAMFVGLALLSIYAVQGLAHHSRVSRRAIVYPVVPWVAIWAAGFALSRYHADAFAGQRPDFTVLGLHPSFAWTVLAYWIGGVLTLSVGFVLRRDDWLSESDWRRFRRQVGAEGPEGEEEDDRS